MKRDMDLLRAILLKIESIEPDETGVYELSVDDFGDVDFQKLLKHFELLMDAEYVYRGKDYTDYESCIWTKGIRMAGYEFLEDTRDTEVWGKTKQVAIEIKSFSIETLKDIAKAIAKKKIENWTGGGFSI